eukprot:3438-Heterococcus_DN1.PRE.1
MIQRCVNRAAAASTSTNRWRLSAHRSAMRAPGALALPHLQFCKSAWCVLTSSLSFSSAQPKHDQAEAPKGRVQFVLFDCVSERRVPRQAAIELYQ